ncbi:YeiH family putative sulfate export transporter [bacterium (Candidatus Blackallbacteria) CG17_big_fil_post_rev_8_21_14_2_50_48_46]|uniref:YeiH family putative sulfate export transporter n=1 Tax=bacterium (Candidatus Blackallbacteria) CG17_big_fil_post_rev_8_21_14_2_50_48_46 TaxID=2014261 RepID=A0A2M7G823_9BACT|nr:MAG: YeiH family putative sulfate export transporter [bacterium (Candidatus Blackallbacteria) CG18_big_fil_WC_8_21_14_2_50_49_26]PIW18239.1 MAG: YeiH family putative sulfate export transporter [bacterium (Candidatus Blackallbacteria) CG17_big_fil_post_rev_8_21_14_2_50_48_46]PIW50670.1 MAG: YeiH family putative sulfate export transporter [bacterium (Candidatus Blackallbacteria) CG13_big_fil_rev_8_21_14_2_50_49_14]
MLISIRRHTPGLGLAILVALLALWLAHWPSLQKLIPLSPLMLAIAIGFVLGNLRPLPATTKPGLTFALKKLLRLGIILLGFKISLGQIQSMGWQGLFLVTLCVAACFGFTLWLGKKMGLNPKLTLLMASGTSICGASAIVATDAMIEAEEQDVAYAVAGITLFGTLAMVSYPLLQMLLHLSLQSYGLWVGSSIHEVAQVVAAGFAHGEQSGKLATLVKMTRVVFLVPVSLGLLAWSFKGRMQTAQASLKKIPLPWFVLLFVVMIGLNSLQVLPKEWVQGLIEVDQWLLTVSMAALGIETRLDKLRATGLKPLWLGLAASLFISLLSLSLLNLLYPSV